MKSVTANGQIVSVEEIDFSGFVDGSKTYVVKINYNQIAQFDSREDAAKLATLTAQALDQKNIDIYVGAFND